VHRAKVLRSHSHNQLKESKSAILRKKRIMSKKGVEKRHSETAIFAALRRTLANKEYNNARFGSDNLAGHFLPSHFRFFLKFQKIRARTKDKLNAAMPGAYEYLIARTSYFDNVFVDALNKNVPQIVLLGAGYDTRVYRFETLNNSTKIIELDIATTQKRKIKCLKKARIDIPKQLTLAPIDFNTASLTSVLEKAGYHDNEKTLFIWEGVSYYLDPESVDGTLAFISHSSHRESIIAFDYAVTITEDNFNNYLGVKEFVRTMRKHHPNEIFKFTIDDGTIESFIEKRGLEMVDHLDNNEIEKTFLVDDSGSLLGQITGLFRFVQASPKNKAQESK